MSLGKDQINRYRLKVGANPEIGYTTTREVKIGDTVQYKHPVTGVVTSHVVLSFTYREPAETVVPATYTYLQIPNDFPPKTLAQIDPANMIVTRQGALVTREEGWGTDTKLTVINA